MDQKELWAVYVNKNPGFEGDGNVVISASGLRKLFAQTYDVAHTHGIKNGRALEQAEAMRDKKPGGVEGLFNQVLGGGK